LYAITLIASRARTVVEQNAGKDIRQVLDDVLQLANAGQSELRALLTDIRSDLVTSDGLAAALLRLTDAIQTRSGLDIHLSLGEEPDVPPNTTEALLLITREALHNVVKHASADRVDIVLKTVGAYMLLTITDNGCGFDPAVSRRGHFGLQSMRERAAIAGGQIDVLSAHGLGTHVRVYIPVRVESDGQV